MKKIFQRSAIFLAATTCFLLAIVLMNGCNKHDDDNNTGGIDQNFSQVNLVASTGTYTGARVDANLINGWGIAFSPTGNAWISAEGTGVSVIYDKTGAEALAPVSIPSHASATGGAPTGQVFNGSADFVLPGGNPANLFLQELMGSFQAGMRVHQP